MLPQTPSIPVYLEMILIALMLRNVLCHAGIILVWGGCEFSIMKVWVLLPLISIVRGDASVSGNCLSQKIYFNNSRRIFLLDGTPSLLDIKELDPSRYDATIDYHADLVNYLPGGGLSIMLQRPTSGQKYPPAGRVSTTRFIKHGKVSLYVKAPALRGVVTTFIMMGTFFPDPTRDLTNADHQGGDEIDWEVSQCLF